MKKQANTVINDERVSAEKRKIGNEACALLMVVLLASVLIQQHIFNAPFAQYAVEFISFIGASVYIVARNFLAGNNLYAGKKGFMNMVVINSVACALTITIINGVLGYARFMENNNETLGMYVLIQVIVFACSAALAFAVNLGVYHLNNRREQQIEHTLNQEDGDE